MGINKASPKILVDVGALDKLAETTEVFSLKKIDKKEVMAEDLPPKTPIFEGTDGRFTTR